ncbi:unnamed protein product [Orchesella dallaii]|uniref:Uncharacterized protein n=1 Tax=Orchesella dallaii TaxID=48710 RepID=A0ABP1PKE0_9HEXA
MNKMWIFGIFFLTVQCVFGSYGPWEDIKKSYEGFEYDREFAEAEQLAFQEGCAGIAEATDGLCFDDCMFRMKYRITRYGESPIMRIEKYETVNYLEGYVLKTTGRPTEFGRSEILNKALHESIVTCASDFTVSYSGAKPDSYWEHDRDLCVKYMNEEDKENLKKMLDCAKNAIKSSSIRYGVWEDIKKSYQGYQFDKEGTEVQHRGFQRKCLNLTGATDGICYDDCMLRISYRLIHYRREEPVIWISKYRGVDTLESSVLYLDRKWNAKYYRTETANEALHQRIGTCDKEMEVSFPEGRPSSFDDEYENLCVVFMNVEEKEKLKGMIDCVKNVLKSD